MLAFTDMQGRLQGKRLHAQYFLDVVVEHGTEGCNYLLAVDIDMNTVDGYAISSWERGYGDMEFVLDWDTIRLLPHLPGDGDGAVRPGLARPRARRAVAAHDPQDPARRASPSAASSRWRAPSWSSSRSTRRTRTPDGCGYRGLDPVNQYNVDYSILGTTRAEPLLRDIRNTMYAAGLDVEAAKGECNFGQHEIGFLYADAMVTADNHSVYKTVAKEIAAQRGQSITFMAKYNEREGSSCHIHLSLRGDERRRRLLGRRRALGDVRQLRRRACSPRCATSRCSTPRTSTPTSASPTARSPRPRSRGARTTAPARSAWSGTAPAPGWRTACPAAT